MRVKVHSNIAAGGLLRPSKEDGRSCVHGVFPSFDSARRTFSTIRKGVASAECLLRPIEYREGDMVR